MGQTEVRKNVIAGFEDYFIYEDARVQNRRTKSFMKCKKEKNGYIRVTLVKNKIKKTCSLHRLLMNGFIYNTENKPQVNHINGIKDDNRLENLEWTTVSENNLHAYRMGLNAPTEKSRKTCSENGKKNYAYGAAATSIKVIDVITKEIFPSIRQASKKSGIKKTTLLQRLMNADKNKGNLILLSQWQSESQV